MKTIFNMFAVWLMISFLPVIALYIAWAIDSFQFDIKQAGSTTFFMILEGAFILGGFIYSLFKSSK